MKIIDIHTHNPSPEAIVSRRPWEHLDFQGLCSVGVHPWDVDDFNPEELSEAARRENVVAIGESGLDKLKGLPLSEQISRFKHHVALSEDLKKPLIIHCVKAFSELLAIRKEMHPVQPWIIHGFRGKPELYNQLAKEGIYVSLGGKFNPDTAALIPDSRLLIETDDSDCDIASVASSVAMARGCEPSAVLRLASTNAERIMNLEGEKRRIVVACDSFKGSLSATKVCEAASEAIHNTFGNKVEVTTMPMADGGEGTAQILTRNLHGSEITIETTDALGRPTHATYGMLPDGSAIIELAAASGLPRIEPALRNPEITTTYGTGTLIADALKRGCRKILLCLGGSATNDAATGLLRALGADFRDINGEPVIPCGGTLGEIRHISVPSELKHVEFTLVCDVYNPFYGANGAAAVFAPQKGANAEMVKRLDRGMHSFAEVLRKMTGTDVQQLAGSGAAGGVAGTLCALLGARITAGAQMVADALGVAQAASNAFLIITGEGRIDSQTLGGKAPMAVLRAGLEKGVPVVAIAGQVNDRHELLEAGFTDVIATTPEGMDLQLAMQEATAYANIVTALSAALKKRWLRK